MHIYIYICGSAGAASASPWRGASAGGAASLASLLGRRSSVYSFPPPNYKRVNNCDELQHL